MARTPILDWWRDFVAAQVRDGPIRDKRTRIILAGMIEFCWRSDPKVEKKLARASKAGRIGQELFDMIAANLPPAEAKKKLARKYRHNSTEAFDKWLQRNLPWPRRDF
jgi:hypothetical protein